MATTRPRTILLDIEGTICPIRFVKDILYPYALTALSEVAVNQWDSPEFIPYKEAFPAEARESPEALIAHARDLTARDVKATYLKNLQGYLWKNGYMSGAYSAPLFDDVLPQLRAWHEKGIQLAIYSSGSVPAQKLFFEHIGVTPSTGEADGKKTVDITYLFSGLFDTINAGPKTEEQSYTKIASQLGQEAGDVLFLSDNIKEIRAALAANMNAILVNRPGNAPVPEEERSGIRGISTLDEIEIDTRV